MKTQQLITPTFTCTNFDLPIFFFRPSPLQPPPHHPTSFITLPQSCTNRSTHVVRHIHVNIPKIGVQSPTSDVEISRDTVDGMSRDTLTVASDWFVRSEGDSPVVVSPYMLACPLSPLAQQSAQGEVICYLIYTCYNINNYVKIVKLLIEMHENLSEIQHNFYNFHRILSYAIHCIVCSY